MLAFDVAAPLGAIGALAMIGIILAWPLWWVALCSVLMLLIVEGVVINFVLARRDSVTVGTDDDAPALRLAVVAVCTAALVAAVLTGFARWTMPDRDFNRDARDVARIASGMAEATATYSPQDPTASVDRAAAMMVPERAAAFKDQFAKSTADLAQRNVTAQASTLSAGVEALGPSAASVAVVLRATQNTPGQQPSRTVLALRVTLTKNSGHWLVFDVLPIHSR
ncbi:putative conserved transmembrane protein [Mycobacterium xenopi 4042]|uniref:Putative conserved transmembrane protein n=1 Tax=Mycobacterium xenopi 4042 TaxID=1299334 RepID=X8BKD5_MYCXE|nr:putative conserved transmembrane protein [Mycobacterium xenopi 4042]